MQNSLDSALFWPYLGICTSRADVRAKSTYYVDDDVDDDRDNDDDDDDETWNVMMLWPLSDLMFEGLDIDGVYFDTDVVWFSF